jgi:hypothetical protein
MSRILSPVSYTPSSPLLPGTVRFNRDQARLLLERGILTRPAWYYDLIDGVVVELPPQTPQGVYARHLCGHKLDEMFGERCCWVKNSFEFEGEDYDYNDISFNFVVTRCDYKKFCHRFPRPEEIDLIGNIIDNTHFLDLVVKLAFCARVGIVEYWALDFARRRLVVYREPKEAGYSSLVEYGEDDLVATLAEPAAFVRVGELLPPIE